MNTDTLSHRKAEEILRRLGYSPLRQFEPKKDQAVMGGEFYEVWATPRVAQRTKTVIVHYYGGNSGCEFYLSSGTGLWSETEAQLKAFAVAI